jgi:hypothetical protein
MTTDATAQRRCSRRSITIAVLPSRDLNWLSKNLEFREQYERAKREGAEAWAEEILDISDDGSNDFYIDEDGTEKVNHENIQRSRLRVDSRKWLMSKLLPKKYGDKVDLNHGIRPEDPLAALIKSIQGASFYPIKVNDDEDNDDA